MAIRNLNFLPEAIETKNILICVNSRYNQEIRSDLSNAGWKNIFEIDNWDSVNAQLNKISKEIKFLLFRNNEIRNIPGTSSLLGGSFKQFFVENNGKEKVEKLKSGLDSDSIQVIDHAIFKMLHYPEDIYSQYYYIDVKHFENIVFDAKLHNFSDEYKHQRASDFSCSKLSGTEVLNPDVFLSHHGLNFASTSIK